MSHAALLTPAFTPRTRTPWAGARLGAMKAQPEPIGESWEFSCDATLSARVGAQTLLEWLSEDAQTERQLLLKLVDAGTPLSVQIHPSDDYGNLKADECGKPELWYVVEHDEGSGLYIGFRDGVTRTHIRDALSAGAALDALMNFVPVRRGDVYVIAPGTPHAIGAGCLLLEPQVVRPGKKGVTYRYWDWNRKYGPDGTLDLSGRPRELHVADALAVTHFDAAPTRCQASGDLGHGLYLTVAGSRSLKKLNVPSAITNLSPWPAALLNCTDDERLEIPPWSSAALRPGLEVNVDGQSLAHSAVL